ncbi:hypothetical protein [Peptostreptococcus anaerobius]|uniref:hypothetical protein n=1 Tax=Peptostreptococcus anaerobius TaxID=1261 RepID=UPI00242ADDEE|nr:hypothetical protein [Peptostreptococcus anaerobius]
MYQNKILLTDGDSITYTSTSSLALEIIHSEEESIISVTDVDTLHNIAIKLEYVKAVESIPIRNRVENLN